jgi:hypothetical protein
MASTQTTQTAIPSHVQAPPAELEREPLVANQRGFGWISDRIAGVAKAKPRCGGKFASPSVSP